MLRRRRLASRHRGTPATQHHASTRVPNAHAPPRALPNRRGAQHLLPHENSTGHHPPSKHPDQARGGGARPRSRWPTYSRCSRGGSRRRSLKPGRRPRQPATNARAPAAAPTACQPPPTNPTTDHDRTVTLGSQARAVTQPHYMSAGQPDPGSPSAPNAEHDKHTPVLTQDGPLGVGRGKETSARLRVRTCTESPCIVGCSLSYVEN